MTTPNSSNPFLTRARPLSRPRNSFASAVRGALHIWRKVAGERRFVAIAQGRAAAFMIHETPRVIAFLDVRPINPGHTLIVPRRPVPNLLQLDEPTAREVFEIARLVALAQVEALQAEGVTLSQANGRAAGQSVFHFHLHVIPSWGPSQPPVPGDRAEIARALRDALRASIPGPDSETPP